MKSLVLLSQIGTFLDADSSSYQFIQNYSAASSNFIVSIQNDCLVVSTVLSSKISLLKQYPVTAKTVQFASYLSMSKSIFVVADAKEMHLLKLDGSAEYIGSIEGGVDTASWSGDMEQMVLITKTGDLLLFNSQFELLKESSISKDFKCCGVSWRPDKECFSILLQNSLRKSKLLVFNRFGIQESESSAEDGLEERLVAWRPSGELVAVIQQNSAFKKQQVVFYERNCLKHGEFSIDFERVSLVQWNSDSTLLCLLLENENHRSIYFFMKEFQLWHRMNYHWYLKYEFGHPQLRQVTFDESDPLLLHVLYTDAFYSFEFSWTIFQNNLEMATVCVSDGYKLLITPFAIQNIPPPKCSFEIELPEFPKEVCIFDGSIYVLGSEFVLEYEFPSVNSLSLLKAPVLKSKYSIMNGIFRQMAVTKNSIFLLGNENFKELVGVVDKATKSIASAITGISIYRIVSNEGICLIQSNSGDIYSLTPDSSNKDCPLSILPLDGYGFLEPCPWFTFYKDPSTAFDDLCGPFPSISVVGLSKKNKFYLSNNCLASSINSFILHEEFIILCSLEHRLLFMHYAKFNLPNLETNCITDSNAASTQSLAPSRSAASQLLSRSVERGASIVTTAICSSSVILQMPRGNLETIQPRSLLYSKLPKIIHDKQYSEAFLICRRHRIDMNIIADVAGTSFDLAEFVKQVDSAEYLNLFLTSLNDNFDLLKNTGLQYSAAAKESQMATQTGPFTISRNMKGKTNRLCALIRQELLLADKIKYFIFISRYIEPIMTSFVRQSPSDLRGALECIRNLRDLHMPSTQIDKYLKYLIFLVKAEELYEVALGMYDLSLCVSIAERSQKDPKEYMPFLEGLNTMDPNLAKFKINDLLKKYSMAVEFLIEYNFSLESSKVNAADNTDHILETQKKLASVLEYTMKHHLFKEAIAFLKKKNATELQGLLDSLYKSYGEYLSSKSEYAMAAFSFQLAGECKEAIACFIKSCRIKEALLIAHSRGLDAKDIEGVVKEGIKELILAKKYQEAASLSVEYLRDHETAVDLLLCNRLWIEALRVSYSSSRLDLLETKCNPSVLEYYQKLKEDFTSWMNAYQQHFDRLMVVRQLKSQQIHQDSMVDDEWEIKSETTQFSKSALRSGTSFNSKSSRRSKSTTKSRFRSKQGGRYEEEYLQECIRLLINQSQEMKEKLKGFLEALLLLNETDKSMELIELFDKTEKLLKSQVEVIFASKEGEVDLDAPLVEKPIFIENEAWRLLF